MEQGLVTSIEFSKLLLEPSSKRNVRARKSKVVPEEEIDREEKLP